MKNSVCIIAPTPPPFGGMTTQARLLSDYLLFENARVIYVKTNWMPKTFRRLFENIRIIRTILNVFFYFLFLIIACNRCKVVHIFACSNAYYYLHVIPSILITKLFKKRLIINYRGGEAAKFFHGFSRHTLLLMKLADAVAVPSGYLQHIFKELGIVTTIIPNISQVEKFIYREPNFGNRISFICTRNFERYYDVTTAVKAFSLARNHIKNATLTLVGDGSLKTEIKNIVKKLSLSRVVKFAGHVSPQQMPHYLSSHDIFVNSSVVDNYPISILEAFAVGLPLISTTAGGIPYLVTNMKNGILVKPGDIEALSNAMVSLAKNISLCKRLSKNAKQTADLHSWEKICPKLKKIYGWG